MKRPLLFLASLLTFSPAIFAQKDVIKIESCSNAQIQHQVDSLKDLYSKDGFILLKEASVAMQSEYELPVIVPLTQGSWYQFIFHWRLHIQVVRSPHVRLERKNGRVSKETMGRCRRKCHFIFICT